MLKRKPTTKQSWQIAPDNFKDNQQAILRTLDEIVKSNPLNSFDSFYQEKLRTLVAIDANKINDKDAYSAWLIKLNMAYNALKRANHHIGYTNPLIACWSPF